MLLQHQIQSNLPYKMDSQQLLEAYPQHQSRLDHIPTLLLLPPLDLANRGEDNYLVSPMQTHPNVLSLRKEETEIPAQRPRNSPLTSRMPISSCILIP